MLTGKRSGIFRRDSRLKNHRRRLEAQQNRPSATLPNQSEGADDAGCLRDAEQLDQFIIINYFPDNSTALWILLFIIIAIRSRSPMSSGPGVAVQYLPASWGCAACDDIAFDWDDEDEEYKWISSSPTYVILLP